MAMAAMGLSSHGRIQLILNGGENLIIRGLTVMQGIPLW